MFRGHFCIQLLPLQSIKGLLALWYEFPSPQTYVGSPGVQEIAPAEFKVDSTRREATTAAIGNKAASMLPTVIFHLQIQTLDTYTSTNMSGKTPHMAGPLVARWYPSKGYKAWIESGEKRKKREKAHTHTYTHT